MDLIDRLSQAVSAKEQEAKVYRELCSAIFARDWRADLLRAQYEQLKSEVDACLDGLIKERES